MKNEKLDIGKFITWMEGDICITVVKKGAIVTHPDAIENTKAVLDVSEMCVPPLLVDIREIQSIDKEARDHFAMRNRTPNVSAIALLIKSQVSKVFGNMFFSLHMPVVPTKLFTSEEKAKEWLKKFVTQKINV